MLERTQLKIDESEKIMELLATTLQTISKGTQQKDGEKPNNKKGQDDRRREVAGKMKEEEKEKDTPKTNPRLDRIEQLLKQSSLFNGFFNDYEEFTSILQI